MQETHPVAVPEHHAVTANSIAAAVPQLQNSDAFAAVAQLFQSSQGQQVSLHHWARLHARLSADSSHTGCLFNWSVKWNKLIFFIGVMPLLLYEKSDKDTGFDQYSESFKIRIHIFNSFLYILCRKHWWTYSTNLKKSVKQLTKSCLVSVIFF